MRRGYNIVFSNTNISISLIKPGPTDTPMTEHLKGGKLSLAPVEKVAKEIVLGVERKKPVIYTPKKWQLIMLIISNLPKFLFNKLDI